MTSILIALYGGLYRVVDGRSWCPSGWNIVLYAGLPYVCWHLFGATWEALAVCSITAASILSGYKSFTFPWLVYTIKFNVNMYRIKRMDVFTPRNGIDLMAGIGVELNDKYSKLKEKMIKDEHDYEENNGWHTWHIFYRFVVPSMMCCAVLGTWSVPYLLASSVIGVLWVGNKFPYASVREFLLGVVLIGGLTLLT